MDAPIDPTPPAPGDPPGEPTPAARAAWARVALRAYLSARGGCTPASVDPEQLRYHLEENVGDLVADLMHLLDADGVPADRPDGVDPARAWRSGWRDYVAERLGALPAPAGPAPEAFRLLGRETAAQALERIWHAFFDPADQGPPYDSDAEVPGADLVQAVGDAFDALRLRPPIPDPETGS